uniref:Uncharacterized protein n=1 Tax=Macaca mulatta TaxID=9544 RepID=A0A5F7ZDA7_MACMU
MVTFVFFFNLVMVRTRHTQCIVWPEMGCLWMNSLPATASTVCQRNQVARVHQDHGRLLWLPGQHGGAHGRSRCCIQFRRALRHWGSAVQCGAPDGENKDHHPEEPCAQGGAPSPFDRNFGTKISARATEWITAKLREAQGRGKTLTTDDSVCVLGISKRNVIFQPVAELKNQMDFE